MEVTEGNKKQERDHHRDTLICCLSSSGHPGLPGGARITHNPLKGQTTATHTLEYMNTLEHIYTHTPVNTNTPHFNTF